MRTQQSSLMLSYHETALKLCYVMGDNLLPLLFVIDFTVRKLQILINFSHTCTYS
jgi:hypothetical protein